MDNLDKKIKDSKCAIEQSNIDNPNQIYNKALNRFEKKKKVNIFNSNLFMKYVISVLLIVAIAVGTIAIFRDDKPNQIIIGNGYGNNLGTSEVYDEQLKKVSSIAEIKNLIFNSSLNSGSIDEEFTLDSESNTSENIGGSIPTSPDINTDHSYNTNIQVEGVDESDIVKVNGDYIYYVTNKITRYYYNNGDSTKYEFGQNCMYILKANGDDLDIIKTITLPNYEEVVAQNDEAVVTDKYTYTPRDILYTDKYIILSVTVSVYSNVAYNTSISNTNYRNYTEFFIYDIENFEQVTKINVPGYVQTTRLINNQLYVISNYYDYKKNNYEGIVPRYAVDDVYYDASLNNIFYCPGMGININSYIVVFRVTLNDNIMIEDFYFLAPSINKVYVNMNAIYLIRTYNNKTEKEDNKVVNWTTSKILAINIDGQMSYDGVIEVKGNIGDKYWIDEYNGFLRVATTGSKSSYKLVDDTYKYGYNREVFNYLTIFKKNDKGIWTQVSQITEGLGEVGESMKSARFNGNVATIVTFKQTDPLYYVDLTDHLNPIITSELKVSGFTVYQHPYKDNYVIGIGYETNENGRTTGYKVALFDVSDKTNIKQVGDAIVFSKDEYHSPNVLYNPKELFLDLDNHIFGFSIIKYERIYNGSYYDYKYMETFKLFKIDLENENPISVMYSEVSDYTLYYSAYNLKRMVFIKDKYYLMALECVYIYQLTSDGVTLIEKKPLF